MKHQALPRDLNGQRLCNLFSYGWKSIETPNEGEVNWKTNEKYPLKPRVLWARWQDAATIVGVRFGSSTRYAVIDIDKDSDYLESTLAIKGALETIGINRTITIRSSWSGGLHIYLPLPQTYPTFSVACAVRQCLEAQGFKLAPGQLEVFPNEKPYGKTWLGEFFEYNGHRLPLQPGTGSCLLDDDLQPLPRAYDLSYFFALFDNAVLSNDHAEISEALGVARTNRRRFRRQATGKCQDWKADLETIISEGWTGHGQTNDLIKAIATYGRVFEKLSGWDLKTYVLQQVLSRPGYEQWCRHQHEIGRKCDRWSNSVENYYWPLGDPPMRERKKIKDICQERAADARDRIAAAVREIRFDGLNVKQRVEHITKAAKCSAQTLYKNRDLWHPNPETTLEPVNPQPAVDTPSHAAIAQQIRESLESVGNGAVTQTGGDNEVCILESGPLKNSPPQGAERGCGGEEGISTGWLPALDWKPGPVGDCHA